MSKTRKDENMEFVIHSVSPKYFAAPFVGTLAVYNNHQNPGMRIELQKVTKELVEEIFDIYDKQGMDIDTFTRFNIYDLGQVLFDDHRSVESFVPKCKCPVVPCDFRKNEDNKKKIMER